MVEISEVGAPGPSGVRRFELQWLECEAGGARDRAILAELAVDDAQAALDWGRARADVVVVIRAADTGYMTAYTAGERAPGESPEMPPLDERAMLAGELSAAPPVAPSRDAVGGVVEWPASPRPVQPEAFFSSACDATGPAAKRLDEALDGLSNRPGPVSVIELRRLLQEHGLFAGDDLFEGGQHAGAPALMAVFDHTYSEEIISYLLAETNEVGAVTEVQLVTFGRRVQLRRSDGGDTGGAQR